LDVPPHNATIDFDPDNFLASLFRTAKAILFSPKIFFEGMNREGGLRKPFIFLACCVLIHTLIAGLLLKNQSLIARNLVFGMVLPFVTAAILYFIITRLFKASGTYEMAFRANAYSAAVALLSWMPLVGVILEFYRIYLIVLGLSSTFSIKVSRAFLAIAMTLLLYMVLGTTIGRITGGLWPGVVP
jgi:hypothetical protein